MSAPQNLPLGTPCWADLWTSDVEGSRRFYADLFGWTAEEPSAEFGGYFMFNRAGAAIAGGMGGMGDMTPSNSWKIYLATSDIEATLAACAAAGATDLTPAMPVADLGVQAVMTDPTGAPLGLWQPGTFAGFATTGEPGAPSWFELSTRDYDRALTFYSSVFGFETNVVVESDQMRYRTLRIPGGDDIGGLMDASTFLADGVGSHWSIYWHTADADETAERCQSLGGQVIAKPEETPYGRLATLADPVGAEFKLRGAA